MEKEKLGLEATELRLGLPGGGDRKRVFSDTTNVDLKLNFSSKDKTAPDTDATKPPPK